MGCAEGRSPFAGSLRVPLRYKFYFLARKKVRGMVERFFGTQLVQREGE